MLYYFVKKNLGKSIRFVKEERSYICWENENILNFYKYIDNIEVTTYNKTIDRVSIFGRAPANKWRILNSRKLHCNFLIFLKEGESNLEELKVYSVSDTYIEYLRKHNPNVYSNKVENKVIKKSIVPIIRMVIKNSKGEKELKGTLRISHMIPVPETELELYDLDNEPDAEYKDLVQNEVIFIRKQREKIVANAHLIYKQKQANDQTAGYVKSALDYLELEKLCDEYREQYK